MILFWAQTRLTTSLLCFNKKSMAGVMCEISTAPKLGKPSKCSRGLSCKVVGKSKGRGCAMPNLGRLMARAVPKLSCKN
ncbi:hypothetical protein [Moraxella lacunata]|uniref:hypothetical protein n=1 Tax=Moraxella lacunata TaxID=477 RepID=UPI003EE19C6C